MQQGKQLPLAVTYAVVQGRKQEAIDKLATELDGVVTRISELEEEEGGNEGAFSDLDKVNKGNVTARLKEIRGDEEAQDEAALLYSWLEELLLEFELKEKLYSRFEVSSIKETSEGFRLEAKAWGEPYDSERHMSKVGIKAATYHRMKILKEADGVTLRFILDI